MPLDGLWLRAPYLHNGAVPTLRDLLEPSTARPRCFVRGSTVIDAVRVGFASAADPAQCAATAGTGTEGNATDRFLFDTTLPGNGNAGHEGPAYGTELPAADKDALVEYLKTF